MQVPRWVESDAPGKQLSVFTVLLPAFCTLAAFGVFIFMVVKTLALASSGNSSGETEEHSVHVMLFVFAFLTFSFGFILKRSANKYFYYKRFSQEPMIQGVYYGNGHS